MTDIFVQMTGCLMNELSNIIGQTLI